ncbi:MAG: DUF5011 domain-containing protein [Mariprofundaceae bacterium]|nr:DUF5011 domain-containing protein [Mariprofundaceae bacterium]
MMCYDGVRSVVYTLIVLLCIGLTGCNPTSSDNSQLSQVNLSLQVPGQSVATKNTWDYMLQLAILEAIAAPVSLGVASITITITGIDMVTIYDVFNVTPGTVIQKTYQVPAGDLRQFTIQAFNGPLGTGTVFYTGTSQQTLSPDTQVAISVPMTVTPAMDITPPIINAPKALVVNATSAAGTAATDALIAAFLTSATVTDNKPNVSAVSHNAPAIFPLGINTVAFLATDTVGNATTQTSTIEVVDNTAPVITLLGASVVSMVQGNPFNDAGTSVVDNVDQNLVATVTGVVNLAVPGTYTLTYHVSDAARNPAQPISRIVHVIANAAPAPTAPTLLSLEDVYGTVQVLANDPDIGDTHIYAIQTPPANGQATISLLGLVRYTPNANFNGTDSLNVKVTDAAGAVGSTLLSVSVTAVNDAPTFTATPVIVQTAPVVGTVLTLSGTTTNDIDADAVTLSYQWYVNTVAIAGETASTYTVLASNVTQTIHCVVTANDGSGAVNATATVPTATVSVSNITNPAPLGTTHVWTGVTDTAWAVATNWDVGTVPSVSSAVYIPVTTNQPIVSASTSIAALNNMIGSSLTISGSTAGTTLTVAAGFDNNGMLDLNSTLNFANLTVTSGVLVNWGTIRTSGTASTRHISSAIDNKGTMSIQYGATINNAGGSFITTNGTVNVLAAQTLTVNGGATNIGAATQLLGAGTVNLAGIHQLNVVSNYTYPAIGAKLSFGGTVTINGAGTLTNQGALTFNNETVNTALINQAVVNVEGNSTFNALLSTTAASTLTISGTAVGTTLTVVSGFTNKGTIHLTSTGNMANLTVSTGILLNKGTIQTSGSASTRTFDASIDNQGLMWIQYNTTLNNTAKTFINTLGTLTVDTASTFKINNGLTQFGTATVLSGAGTVDFAGTSTLELVNNITYPSGSVQLSFTGTVLINGAGILTNQGTLNLNSETINLAVINQGVIQVDGSSAMNGAFSNVAASSVTISGSLAGTTLTIANGFINNGMIDLTSSFNSANLIVSAGTLVNKGTIATNGTASIRNISAAIDNQGSMTIHSDVTLNGVLSSPAATVGNMIGNGAVVTLNGGLNIDNALIDNVLLNITAAPVTLFNNTILKNYVPTATALTFALANTTTTFNNLKFETTPTTGRYIDLTGTGSNVTIAGASRTPLYGLGKSTVVAGSTLNWGLVTDDTDGDGVSDSAELAFGTNPIVAELDHDQDGLFTSSETGTGIFVSNTNLGTNPLSADTDGDGIGDGTEVFRGQSAFIANTVVYVDAVNGSDTYTGASWVLAKQTLTAGLAAAPDGSIATNATYILVGAGSYAPIIINARNHLQLVGSVSATTFHTARPLTSTIAVTTVGRPVMVEGNSTNIHFTGFVMTGGSAALGGGVRFDLSDGGLHMCDVVNNASTSDAGGVYVNNSLRNTVVVDQNTLIAGNSATNSGGGLFVKGSFFMTESFVSNNKSNGAAGTFLRGGGGMVLAPVSSVDVITVKNSIISGNESKEYGGGIYVQTPANMVTMFNNLITGNVAGVAGGGIKLHDPLNSVVSGSTIAYNQVNSVGAGGGITYFESGASAGSTPSVHDNIFWFNEDNTVEAAINAGESYNDSFYIGIMLTIAMAYNNDVGQGMLASTDISVNPNFQRGFFLNQTLVSPSSPIDAGSQAASIVYSNGETTNEVGGADVGQVDMGYHYMRPFSFTGTPIINVTPINTIVGSLAAQEVKVKVTIGGKNIGAGQRVFVDIGTGSAAGVVFKSLTSIDPAGTGTSVLARDNGDGSYSVFVDTTGVATGTLVVDVNASGSIIPAAGTLTW